MADEGTSGAGAAGAGAGSAAQNKWGQAGGRTAARVGVQQAVATSLAASFAANKRTPDDCFAALQANNTTHFAVEELERLLAAFKRVTHDRLKVRLSAPLPPARPTIPLARPALHGRDRLTPAPPETLAALRSPLPGHPLLRGGGVRAGMDQPAAPQAALQGLRRAR